MGFSRAKEKNVLFYLYRLLLPVILILGVILLKPWKINKENEIFVLRSVESSPSVKILSGAALSEPRDRNCNFFTCFNVYRCGRSINKLSVYIYPVYR